MLYVQKTQRKDEQAYSYQKQYLGAVAREGWADPNQPTQTTQKKPTLTLAQAQA
mgnify:CR=1 FL=1